MSSTRPLSHAQRIGRHCSHDLQCGNCLTLRNGCKPSAEPPPNSESSPNTLTSGDNTATHHFRRERRCELDPRRAESSAADQPNRRPTRRWIRHDWSVREDAEIHSRLRIPADRSGASIKLEIRWEDGELEHHWFWLPELPTVGNAEARRASAAQAAAARLSRNPGLLGERSPSWKCSAEARFIVCPRRSAVTFQGAHGGRRRSASMACAPRAIGAAAILPICAPPSTPSRAPERAFVALNPLHAIANRQPYNTSPYLPQCSLYRNFIYLDVEKTPGYPAPTDWIEREIEDLRATEFVEYERVARVKLAALQRCFRPIPGTRRVDRSSMLMSKPKARPFTISPSIARSTKTMHRRDPERLAVDRLAARVSRSAFPRRAGFRRGPSRASAVLQVSAMAHRPADWPRRRRTPSQQGMKIGLYHDLALATDRLARTCGPIARSTSRAAAWAPRPTTLLPTARTGAFRRPIAKRTAPTATGLFAQSIRNSARHGGALRIDHVMRFFRLYWIPDGMPPPTAPTSATTRRTCWASSRWKAFAGIHRGGRGSGDRHAGEVRHRLAESGILSYRLLWFERNGDGSFRRPAEYPAQAAVSTTTHDLPTLAGFFPAAISKRARPPA